MSKCGKNDKVRIIYHPREPRYCGLQGKVSDVRKGPAPLTVGAAPDGTYSSGGAQWKYDVDVGPYCVTDLEEEWIEPI